MTWTPEHHEKYGVCRRLFHERIRDGWAPQSAATTTPAGRERFTFDGHYCNKNIHANRCGINRSTVDKRMRRKWPLSTWFQKTEREKRDIPAIARAHGLNVSTLKGRLNRMSMEQALAMEVQKKHCVKAEKPKAEDPIPADTPVNRWLRKTWRVAA